MCFIKYIYAPEDKIVQIAEEDIVCTKLVKEKGNLLTSLYRNGFVYLNILYHKSVTLTAKMQPCIINSIIHGGNIIIIHEGIHANINSSIKTGTRSIYVVKAVIPKGTKYYSTLNEIVAEKMIIYNPYPIED